MNRRKFLSLLGFAPVAAPLAAMAIQQPMVHGSMKGFAPAHSLAAEFVSFEGISGEIGNCGPTGASEQALESLRSSLEAINTSVRSRACEILEQSASVREQVDSDLAIIEAA